MKIKFCPNCGNKQEGNIFCSNCGNKLLSKEKNLIKSIRTTKKKVTNSLNNILINDGVKTSIKNLFIAFLRYIKSPYPYFLGFLFLLTLCLQDREDFKFDGYVLYNFRINELLEEGSLQIYELVGLYNDKRKSRIKAGDIYYNNATLFDVINLESVKNDKRIKELLKIYPISNSGFLYLKALPWKKVPLWIMLSYTFGLICVLILGCVSFFKKNWTIYGSMKNSALVLIIFTSISTIGRCSNENKYIAPPDIIDDMLQLPKFRDTSITPNNKNRKKYIQKQQIKIVIPDNWSVLTKAKKDYLLKKSNYPGQLDYCLTLRDSKFRPYPNISVLIQKDSKLTELGLDGLVKKLTKEKMNAALTILLDKKNITDFSEIGDYFDKENEIFYKIVNKRVDFQGNAKNYEDDWIQLLPYDMHTDDNYNIYIEDVLIKSISAIIVKKDYIVSLTLDAFPEDFEEYKNALEIMAKSTSI